MKLCLIFLRVFPNVEDEAFQEFEALDLAVLMADSNRMDAKLDWLSSAAKTFSTFLSQSALATFRLTMRSSGRTKVN